VTTRTYTVYFEYFKDDAQEGYNVVVPALPGCITWGATLEEARRMAQDAIQAYVTSLEMDGDPIPEDPAMEGAVRVEKLSVAHDPAALSPR
jgi:antitoxin HicB